MGVIGVIKWIGILSAVFIIIGYTIFAPIAYEEGNELVGFDIDLAKAVCEKLGIEAKFQIINWNSKVFELNSGAIDVIWNGMTITDEIKEATSVTIDGANMTAEQFAQFTEAQGEVTSALGRLIAVAENYPELKANQNFIELQSQLEGTENRIAVERQRYNEVVKAFNKRVVTFPNNIFASLFGFSKRDFFASQQGADVAPVVEF